MKKVFFHNTESTSVFLLDIFRAHRYIKRAYCDETPVIRCSYCKNYCTENIFVIDMSCDVAVLCNSQVC